MRALVLLTLLVGYCRAYVELDDEGKGLELSFSNLSVLSIESLIASKKERRLFNAMVDALILGDLSAVTQRLTAYKGLGLRSSKYDRFVGKCQKHVKIHLPVLTNASSVLSGAYHVSFHWRF
ncbi:hypothetical protein [Helicobacter bizzozeronii]|uniref:hypothetical protein n=1 Tax=Helicobacter bizzozeronii TaxID=56877 RepID=UPI000554CF9A|nr:hypothetical protein [Helicobacter bizzozeronii]GMT38320.1 hypothetical protein NHP20013_03870 [Helicobacter bizzozeronii]